jgi:hypothetical protein
MFGSLPDTEASPEPFRCIAVGLWMDTKQRICLYMLHANFLTTSTFTFLFQNFDHGSRRHYLKESHDSSLGTPFPPPRLPSFP